MPTSAQSTKPVTTSRKPRKKEQDVIAGSEGRAGSAGGIVLETQTKGNKSEKMSTTSTLKGTAQQSSKDAEVNSGPHRQRRRPRKLNRDPVPQKANETSTPTGTGSNETAPSAATAELEALKSRVRGLEAKVEELYKSGADVRSARSPRRRGKKKHSSQQVPTLSNPGDEEDEEEADEELVRLEDELEVARRDLASYAPRSRNKRSTSNDSEFIEEIPRDSPQVEEMADTGNRQVTLTGSYRIPLPTSVSMQDVKSIQSGVTAAQNVAKSFLEQRRASQAVQNESRRQSQPTTSKPKAKPSTSRQVSTSVAKGDNEKQSWSEWFGGYSVAISRAVQNIEAEAAVEAQKSKKPQLARTASTTPAKTTKTSKPSKPATKTSTGATAKGNQRPPLKQRAGNLSSEQVHGLMG